MRAFKGQAKPRLRPDMFWCAPQIRAKGYIGFFLSLSLFSSCLKGVGGSKREKTEEEREVGTHVLVKHSSVEFAQCFRTVRFNEQSKP